MSETIEPALSAQEWAIARDPDALENVVVGDDVIAYFSGGAPHVAVHEGGAIGKIARPEKLIAMLNAALLDDDPRKITRQKVTAIRQAAHFVEHGNLAINWAPGDSPWSEIAATIRSFADALESYVALE